MINRELNNIVAMVTPDIGLFEEPTTPAMYAATDEKRNALNIIKKDNPIERGKCQEFRRFFGAHCINKKWM